MSDTTPISFQNEPSENVVVPVIDWSPEVEELLLEWSEKALCYTIMHNSTKSKYSKKYYLFIIPIIVLSTITGTINIGMQSVIPTEYIHIANIAVGGFNLFTGLLTTLLNFFKYAEKTQQHTSIASQWYKFYRTLTTELALHPNKRKKASEFFKQIRFEFEKIIEQAPNISTKVIQEFRKQFKYDINNSKIHLPEIIIPIRPTRDYHHYFKEYKDRIIQYSLSNGNENTPLPSPVCIKNNSTLRARLQDCTLPLADALKGLRDHAPIGATLREPASFEATPRPSTQLKINEIENKNPLSDQEKKPIIKSTVLKHDPPVSIEPFDRNIGVKNYVKMLEKKIFQ